MRLFLPEEAAKTPVARVFANAGQTFFESLNLSPYLDRVDEFVSCDDWEKIRGWLAQGKPIVALTAHTANWDMLAAYFIKKGIPLSTIGREAKNPKLQLALAALRDAYGVRVIWRQDGSGLKQIVSELKERRIVSALIDQDTKVSSTHVPFFGRPASTPSGLIVLAKKYSALIVAPFIVRRPDGRFHISVEEIDGSLSVEEILTQYSLKLQALIERHPGQWVWFHKRWRTEADGRVLSSREYLDTLSKEIERREHRGGPVTPECAR